MKRKHISSCFAYNISDPSIKISSEEFADFIMKYEDANDCDSFYNYSDSMHNTLVDKAIDFMNSIDPVLKNAVVSAKSLYEVLVKLDVGVCGEWEVSHGFWENIFKSLIDSWNGEDDIQWLEWLLCSSSELAEDCIKRGLFDEAIVKPMLIKVIQFICDYSDNCLDGMELDMKIIKLCKAWDNRRDTILSCSK